MTRMGRYGWKPYVPVAVRRRKAEREMDRLAKKGTAIQPVVIAGRTIAKSFWGKAWCANLESYSDFENRLPRGRTYVRNGSVCHLEIGSGRIEAKVSGSSLYDVTIAIKPLSAAEWSDLKNRCIGKIASLLDLLGGRLADGVMKIVTDRKTGLFPKPRQISFDCSCPDWADMCKHVAAVLYGVAARLDEKPELLFLLRGVNHEELVSATVEEAVAAVVKGGSRRRVAEDQISDVFGIDVGADTAPESAPSSATAAPRTAKRPRPDSAFPEAITGTQVRELRERLGLSQRDFALMLGVSGASIVKWEKSEAAVGLQKRSRSALARVWNGAGGTKAPRGY
jgi:uncharacterized Zn finger protein